MKTIMTRRAGPLSLLLTVSSLLFLIASLAFVTSLVMQRSVPRVAPAFYAIGAVPIALRAFVSWASSGQSDLLQNWKLR